MALSGASRAWIRTLVLVVVACGSACSEAGQPEGESDGEVSGDLQEPNLPEGEATPPWGCRDSELPDGCEDALPYGWRATSNAELAHLEGVRCLRGSLELTDFTDSTLQSLESLEVVCGELTVVGTELRDLSGLPNLREVGQINLEGNDDLRSLTGLSALEHIERELSVTYNGSLEDLAGLERIEVISGVRIGDNERLASVDALSSLLIAGHLFFRDLPQVREIRFPSLELAGSIAVTRMAELRTLDLGPLQGGDALLVNDNPKLQSIEGSGALTILRNRDADHRTLVLRDLPELTDVSGLASLAEIGASLEIWDTGLTDLDDLGALDVIGGPFTVLRNRALPGNVALAFGDQWPNEPHKIGANLGDEPYADECPWSGDGQCDDLWDSRRDEEGTGLCESDPYDCDVPDDSE